LTLFATLATMPAANAQLASPITSAPGSKIIPGEVVWADLVTTDVDAATAFYTQVFGWQARPGDDPGYVELASNGQVFSAVARYDDDDAAAGSARWLVSISVADVDESVRQVEREGGSTLQAPEEFPDRGRFAVVADSQGAVFILLRASGGDPPDTDLLTGSWGWAELWTQDVKSAARFYENAMGYRAMRTPNDSGPQPVVLTTKNRPRATIVGIPWEDVEPNWIPYVPVGDARETLHRAKAAGGSVLLTSDDVEDDEGSFAAVIADPTGGVFAIQQAGGAR
jgi:predicted enzyme related to lactoylglutathione lyase